MAEYIDDGVLLEVLRFVHTPHTVEEVADNFEWHPQTARRYLWELRRVNKANTLNRKQGRQKLWQARTGAASGGAVTLVTSNGSVTLKSLAGWRESAQSSGNLIGAALAYVWRRAFYRRLDQTDTINVARQGSLDVQLEVYPYLAEVHRYLKMQTEALEQMLLELPELWNEGSVVLQMIGDVDRAAMEDAAAKLEPIIRAWQDQKRGQG